MTVLRRILRIAPLVILLGCGSSLPLPESVEPPASAFVEVPYPPPAALAETLVRKPDQPDVVWVDGEWLFRGSTYAWQRGGWVLPPKKARYAKSKVVFARDGRVLFAAAGWYAENGEPLERIRPLSPAVTPVNDFTDESQTAR